MRPLTTMKLLVAGAPALAFGIIQAGEPDSKPLPPATQPNAPIAGTQPGNQHVPPQPQPVYRPHLSGMRE